MKLDQYVLQARVAPLAVALLPLAVLAGLLGLQESPILAAVVAVVGPAVLALVDSDVVRSLGRDLESRLWHDWGGSPTTAAFLADDESGADRRRRLEAVTGIPVRRDRWSVERA